MTHTYVNRCRRWLMVAVILAPTVTVWGQTELLNHRVFAKYPSARELQQRIDEFRAAHPEEYAAAFKDFAVAVRFNLELERPRIGPQPIVLREWVLYFPPLRPAYDSISDEERSRGPDSSPEWVAFLREHVDELTLEHTAALRMVAVDVLLNGWDDWSEWNSARLKGYRERYPDIDRREALTALINYDGYESQERAREGATQLPRDPVDVSGMLLHMLVSPGASSQLRGAVGSAVGDMIRNDIDALDFVVKAYLATEDPKIRYQCLAVWGSLSQSLSNDDRLAFWLPYLETPDTRLRAAAVGGVGNSRRRPRDVPLAEHPDREIVERLRRIAEHDADKQVRQHALNAIKSFEDDSPPRGLHTYEKEGE